MFLQEEVKKGGENRFGLVKTLNLLVETEKIKNRTKQAVEKIRGTERNDEEENKTNETVMCLSV